MEQTTTQNYLGRCKDCDYVIFATAEDVQEANGFREVTAGTGVYRVNGGLFARCTNRHKVFACKVVKGTFSKDHQCDSRCLNAKGWECTCSCGGANHGRGHVATVVQAAEVTREPIPATVEDFMPYTAPATPERPLVTHRHLGEVGLRITGEVFVKTIRKLANGSVLYVFTTTSNGDTIKWFVPAKYDPSFELGSTLTIRAKVKSHGEFNGTPETVVLYVEEV